METQSVIRLRCLVGLIGLLWCVGMSGWAQPFANKGYCGAGLYRHVWLVTTQSVHVSHWGTYITTPYVSDREAQIRMEVEVDNHCPLPVQARLLTRFYELDSLDRLGQEVAVWCDTLPIHAHGRARTESTIRIAEPKRWDMLSPNRYVARTEVYVDGHCQDTYHTPFGIRTLSFSAQDGFRLNGRRVPIQGVCLHHDLGSLGAAFNKSALHRQLCMLREMGCCVL